MSKIKFRAFVLLAASVLGLLVAPVAHAENIALQWAKNFNGPTNDFDMPAGVAVDGHGDIVIAGNSSSLASNFDWYIAKYAGTTGAVLWDKFYNGPGNSDDEVSAMALDASGNVLVTGTSVGSRGYADIYTAKYAAADGALLWEKRYGMSGVNNDTRDFPSAIAVDSAGNVIVAGAVGRLGTSYAYIVKYAAADGAVLWEHLTLGTGGSEVVFNLALDASGDVLIAGSFKSFVPPIPGQNNYDMFTAKLSGTNGAVVWKTIYAGPDNGPDSPVALAVAPNGDAVLTATTYNDTTSVDIYTARYAAANGALIWAKRYDSPGHGVDFPYDVKVDSTGNVIVTGSVDPGLDSDAYTVKYAAADGAVLWEKRYAGPNHQADIGYAVLLDASDNVIITGGTDGNYNGTQGDLYTAKYASANGALLWEKRYNGPGNKAESANRIAATPDGGLVIVGSTVVLTNGTQAINDILTIKYLPSTTTEPPVLISPATASAFAGTLSVNYSLPDTAANGTVKLTFSGATTTELTLVNTDGAFGGHSFSLPTANLNVPTHVAALSGPAALADGLYTVTLSSQDQFGDAAASTVSSNVRIDTIPPVLPSVTITSNNANPLYAKVAHTITVSFTANEAIQTPTGTIDGVAAAISNAGGNTWQAKLVVSSTTPQGAATFSISVKDLAGNALAPVTATTDGSSVTVDRTGPFLVILGANPQTVEGATTYVDPGATASDMIAGNLTGAIQVGGTLNMNVVGTYTRTYTVADFAGNTATASRTVKVVDTTLPVIVISGANPAMVEAGAPYLDAGATASDTVAGNLTAAIQAGTSVNINVVGDYAVTYSVSDGHNTAMAIRTVKVRDTIPPLLTILGANPATVEAGSSYNDAGATASDSFKGNLTAAIQATSNVNAHVPGDYTVTYNVSDGQNPVTAIRVVQVVDTTGPTITHVPPTVTITADNTNHAPVPDFTSHLTATDNVGVTGVVQSPVAGTIVGVGTFTITLTVSDAAHNSANCTTTLTVLDGPALPGRYAALLADAQGAFHAHMELKLTRGQFVSGYLVLDDGRRVRFPGKIVPTTTHAITLALSDGSSLALVFDGFGHVAATLTGGGGVLTATGVLADAGAPAGVPGTYTAVLEPEAGGAPGWLYAVVSSRGAMRISGILPDGSPVSAHQGSIVDRHGDALIFVLGKGTHALLAGQVHFENLATSDFAGALTFKGTPCAANGAKFTPATSGLPAGAYPLTLTGAGLNIASTVTLRPDNTAGVLAPVLSFTPRSKPAKPAMGTFYLTFRATAAHTGPLIKGSGIFHQKLGIGVGQFGNVGATGRVLLGESH